jgi:hypothetical protein
MFPLHSHRPTPASAAGIARLAASALIALLLVALAACTPTTYSGGRVLTSDTPSASSSQTPGGGVTLTTIPTATATGTPTKPVTLPVPTTTPAPLIPAIRQVAHSATLNGTSTGPVSVSCPQGSIALGGGWTVPTANRVFKALLSGNTWSVWVTNPAPVATGSISQPGPTVLAWVAHSTSTELSTSTQLGPAVEVPVTAFVECLSGVSGRTLTRRAHSATVTASAFNNLAATCNPGEVPVGFGFDLSAASTALELRGTMPETFEAGVWWNFWVQNHDSLAHGITLFANCLSNPPAFNLVSFTGSDVFGHQSSTISVPCPSGSKVAGGGLDYKGALTGNLFGLQATSTGWQGSLYAATTSGLLALQPQVWALCLTFA